MKLPYHNPIDIWIMNYQDKQDLQDKMDQSSCLKTSVIKKKNP